MNDEFNHKANFVCLLLFCACFAVSLHLQLGRLNLEDYELIQDSETQTDKSTLKLNLH